MIPTPHCRRVKGNPTRGTTGIGPTDRSTLRPGAHDWQLTRVRLDLPEGGVFHKAIRSSLIHAASLGEIASAGTAVYSGRAKQ